MPVGDNIKVHLPGEAPWAIITAELSDGRIMARIDNYTVGHLHGYRYGDVATFDKTEDGVWVLASLDKQERNGPQK